MAEITRMMLPGWRVDVPGVSLPAGCTWREDEDFLYLCRDGEVTAVFTHNATPQALRVAILVLGSSDDSSVD